MTTRTSDQSDPSPSATTNESWLEILNREEASVPWSEISFPKMMIFGSSMYMLECALLHPAEVVKTRLQVDLKQASSLAKQTKEEIRLLAREAGFRGFYRAFWFNTFLSIPAQWAYISSYSAIKESLEDTRIRLLAPLIAGGMAEVVGACLYVPLDIVVNRVVIQTCPVNQRIGGFAMAQKIYREEGRRGFTRGFNAHIATYVPSSAIWWSSYEAWKYQFYRLFPSMRGPEAQILSGCLTGALVAFVSNPIDIAKTRLQTNIGVSPCRTIYGTLKKMIVEEGLQAFGKGLLPKVLFTTPVSAVTSILYETAMTLSKKDN